MKTLTTSTTRVSSRRTRFFRAALTAALMAPIAALAQNSDSAVDLGSTKNFAVLGASLVSNIPTSAITGDVGLSPAAGTNITGFGLTEVTGTIYTVSAGGPAGSVVDAARLTAAQGDLTIAYNNARDRTPVPVGPFLNPGAGDLAGLVLVPGIYKFTGNALISTDVTLTGSDTSVWIFQIASALNVPDGGIKVILAGGAKASNVFWQVGTSAALGTTAQFKGTIMADQSITLASGAKLDGRALARIAAVTLSANVVTVPPVAPALGTPNQGTLNVPILTTLIWAKSPWAVSYRVQLSTDSTFATTLVNDSTLTDTLRAVGPLANKTVYYWRVYTKNAAGTSTFSVVHKFTTIVAVPVASALKTPAQNAISIPLSTTLTWSAFSDAITYRVQLSTDSTFVTTLVNDSTVTDTSRAIGPLANNTAYYWRVNAKNVAGTGTFSAIRKFTTIVSLPGVVQTLKTPVQNATGIPVSTTLSWSAAGDAATYRVQLSVDSTFVTTLVNDSTVTDTSRAVGSLANNTVYYWRVNCKNAAGTSAFSVTHKFTTIVAVPGVVQTLKTPAQNATGIPVSTTLTWSAVSGAVTYRVQLSTDSTFVTTFVNDSTVLDSSRAVGPLANNTAYYWRLNSKNAAGTSTFSVTHKFITIVAVPGVVQTLKTPAQNATGIPTSTTLTWSAVSGTVTYRVQLSTDSAFATTLINDSTVIDTSRAVTSLANNTVYYWRVNCKNAAGTSAFSTRMKFTTATVGILPAGFSLQNLNLMNNHFLSFRLPQQADVVIRIYSTEGRMISLLLNEHRIAGNYTVPLSPGLKTAYYFLDFRAGNYHKTLKIHP